MLFSASLFGSMLFVAFVLGVVLLVLQIAVFAGSQLWRHLYAWIDDRSELTKEEKFNPILRKIMEWRGYELADRWNIRDGDDLRYRHKKSGEWKYSADGALASLLVGSFLGPILLIFILQIYPVALFLLTLLGAAHAARYVRRFKKVFKKHAEDPDAHKAKAA